MALLVRQSLVGTTVRGDPTEPFFRDITIERAFQSGTRSGDPPDRRARRHRARSRSRRRTIRPYNTPCRDMGQQQPGLRERLLHGPAAGTGTWALRREVWLLDDDGRLRVVITTGSSDAGSRGITLVYRRPSRATAADGLDSGGEGRLAVRGKRRSRLKKGTGVIFARRNPGKMTPVPFFLSRTPRTASSPSKFATGCETAIDEARPYG